MYDFLMEYRAALLLFGTLVIGVILITWNIRITVQKLVIIIGTALTVLILLYPFKTEVQVRNPNYVEVKGSFTSYLAASRSQNKPYIMQKQDDYKKKFTVALASIIGTGVLAYVLKFNNKVSKKDSNGHSETPFP